MNRTRVMLMIVPLVLVTLVGAAPWRNLPPCVLGRFRASTPRDPQGTIVGPVDPSDWGCLAGQPHVSGGVPSGPPTQFCFGPAYPNPSNGEVVLRFSVPRASVASITVYGQKHGPHS